MIRKIKTTEYLEQYGSMSDGERRKYQSRVEEWLSNEGRRLLDMTERPMAKSQNIMLLSARWKETELRAFAEGARLMSALIGVADTWLPTQLYAKSAYRAVRQMVEVMGQVSGGDDAIATQETNKTGSWLLITEEQKRRIVEKYTKRVLEKQVDTPATKPQGTVTAATTTLPHREEQGGGSLARPRHIDQYVHLLPEATQKRAAGYGELMREFDMARENLRIVKDDVHASDRDREQWAKKVSSLDGQIGDIRRELDREWEKVAASGKVVMDDLGMAHVVSEERRAKSEEFADTAQSGGATGAEQDAPATDKKADDQRRAALLRKWLIDTRYGNKNAEKRAKYQEKWREKYREMVRIGGIEAVTEKVREAAKHYEIDIDALSSTHTTHNHNRL